MALMFALFLVFSILTSQATAETHKVTFTNNCGHGTPKLVRGGNVLSTGQDYTSNGPFETAIAYLDNGNCKLNGEGCGTVEITLKNGANGAASSADISLIPPLAFSDALGFQFTGSCNGGAFCGDSKCNTAFFKPDDNCVQVQCQQNDAGINVIFCGGSTHFTDSSQKGSPCNGAVSNNSTTASSGSTNSGTNTNTASKF
ncbi:uncharacterized protein FOMMEDRAFT_156625 [Fomitiporia mediterranea MF3/22]|uniref:uncharacterized protein n=1 Tax=Fomitiporia mediterranea (strain MF3/22) TaxID=694068 RepID=UPI00044093CB|nr:uncharacterized protein FOMMEDRAFT_156625 [Fomitiporia mediterranea MF3/22]EJD03238.1 hypothetical protein FOMMEDRAFT_156625 [Fomitiporia mediterranea MF3/22]